MGPEPARVNPADSATTGTVEITSFFEDVYLFAGDNVLIDFNSTVSAEFGLVDIVADIPFIFDPDPDLGVGALVEVYGTLITGSNAGKRLLGVSYPSMDAIEKTYDGLRASADYQALMSEISLERREIIRFAG